MKQQIEKAGRELGDLLVLVFDETPNGQQVLEFSKEGMEALGALANSAAGLPPEKRVAALSHLINALHARLNEGVPALRLE